MKLHTKLLTTGLLSLALSPAFAASISVGDNLNIEAINGNPIDARNTALNEGTHVIALKFREIYVVNADDHTWVRSGPLFTTVTVKPGERLTIETGDLFSESEARDFLESPLVTISSNQRADTTQSLMNQSQVVARLLQNNQ